MPKRLISVRISEDILEKIDIIKDSRNIQVKVQDEQIRHSREYVLLEHGYFAELSTADVIEVALLEFFEKYQVKN